MYYDNIDETSELSTFFRLKICCKKICANYMVQNLLLLLFISLIIELYVGTSLGIAALLCHNNDNLNKSCITMLAVDIMVLFVLIVMIMILCILIIFITIYFVVWLYKYSLEWIRDFNLRLGMLP